jgi:hypothetical protein
MLCSATSVALATVFVRACGEVPYATAELAGSFVFQAIVAVVDVTVISPEIVAVSSAVALISEIVGGVESGPGGRVLYPIATCSSTGVAATLVLNCA